MLLCTAVLCSFLDLAKAWGQRLVDMMYADAGGHMAGYDVLVT
jgi:hypothetical protein